MPLALVPALEKGYIETTGIIANCASGVTGAGRKPAQNSHYPELKWSREEGRLSASHCLKLCNMGIPMGLQCSITAIGSVVLQGAVNGLGSSIVAAQTAGSKAAQFLSVPLESIGTAMTEYIQTMKLMGDQSATVFSRFAIAEKDRFLHKLDNFRIDHIWMNVLI